MLTDFGACMSLMVAVVALVAVPPGPFQTLSLPCPRAMTALAGGDYLHRVFVELSREVQAQGTAGAAWARRRPNHYPLRVHPAVECSRAR